MGQGGPQEAGGDRQQGGLVEGVQRRHARRLAHDNASLLVEESKVYLFGACRRRTPRARSSRRAAPEGSRRDASLGTIHISTRPRHSPSACSENLVKNRSAVEEVLGLVVAVIRVLDLLLDEPCVRELPPVADRRRIEDATEPPSAYGHVCRRTPRVRRTPRRVGSSILLIMIH